MKKLILSLVSTIIIVSLCCILYIKNIIPKETFLPLICSNLSKKINMQIQAKDIYINPFKGIILKNVTCINKIKNTNYNIIYDIKHIILKYDLLKTLKNKRIYWHSLSFYKPKITITNEKILIKQLNIKHTTTILKNTKKNISLYITQLIKKSLNSFSMQKINIDKGYLKHKDLVVSELKGSIFFNTKSNKTNINLIGKYRKDKISLLCTINTKPNQIPISLNIKSKNIDISASLLYSNPNIKILSLIYKPGNNKLFFKGILNLQNKKISLSNITNLSLLKAKPFISESLNLKGYLNLSSKIQGFIDKPLSFIIQGTIKDNSLFLNDTKLDKINSDFLFTKKVLAFKKLTFITKNNDIFSGYLTLNYRHKKPIIKSTLTGNINFDSLKLFIGNKIFEQFQEDINFNKKTREKLKFSSKIIIKDDSLTIEKLKLNNNNMFITGYGTHNFLQKKPEFKIGAYFNNNLYEFSIKNPLKLQLTYKNILPRYPKIRNFSL